MVPLGLDLEPFASLERGRGRRPAGGARRRRRRGPAHLRRPGRPDQAARRAAAGVRPRRASGARLHLAVVGDGEIRAELERLARRARDRPAVSFLGYRRDLPRIAAAADIAVLSSDNEGTPVSLIEAARPGGRRSPPTSAASPRWSRRRPGCSCPPRRRGRAGRRDRAARRRIRSCAGGWARGRASTSCGATRSSACSADIDALYTRAPGRPPADAPVRTCPSRCARVARSGKPPPGCRSGSAPFSAASAA